LKLIFQAGEDEARRRLDSFTSGLIDRYAEDRDRMDLEGTSTLSPYLRFGMLSARQAVNAALSAEALSQDAQARKGAETWLNELIWREFYFSVLYHFPFVQKESFRAEMRNIRWLNNEEDFTAWKEGRTGYPIVDAALHQLTETGWMHNRARMIVASFLTKDLPHRLALGRTILHAAVDRWRYRGQYGGLNGASEPAQTQPRMFVFSTRLYRQKI
jgi:deoxyribodipyrimidine photo-lyase